jgi:hypothetical protein
MGSPSATSMGFPSPPSSPTGGAAALGPSNLFTSSKNYYMTVPDEPSGEATATAPQPLSPIGKIIPQPDDEEELGTAFGKRTTPTKMAFTER